jgi:hypothetical protein
MDRFESPLPQVAPSVPGLAWSIPGLEEDPTMCLRCRSAQMLCGKPICPILLRYEAVRSTLTRAGDRDFEGTTPPGVFVGRFGYPSVSIGPLLSPAHGDTMLYDTPEDWVGRPVNELVGFRAGLLRGTTRLRVTDAARPSRTLEEFQLLTMASESVESSVTFRRAPRGTIALSDTTPPFGPSAPIDRARWEVRRVDARLERMTSDVDAGARVAVGELYRAGVRVSRIQRAFSVGALGQRRRRRLVPTRWSITAVDDLLSKANLARVRELPEFNQIQVYQLTALDNRWIIALWPGAFRYESIEAWYPATLWNPNPREILLLGDFEGDRGRTTYAGMGGCYYAARLAASEALLRMGRRAGVLVLREVHPGEILPLGVWNVREHVRAALAQRPEICANLGEFLDIVRAGFEIPLDRWLRASEFLHRLRHQRTLDAYLGAPELPPPEG